MVREALTNIEKNCADIERYGGGTFVIRENYNQGRYDAYLTVLESLRLEEKSRLAETHQKRELEDK